jgi:alpha-tubulin suppressor-like RCC1 family protein
MRGFTACRAAHVFVCLLGAAAALQIADVVAGEEHTCILTVNGLTLCWGLNADGQLGYGHNNSIGDAQLPFTAGFVDTGVVPMAMLAAGYGHTCALAENASVMCWGLNSFGQLGYGHRDNIGDNELPLSAGYVQLPGGVPAMQIVAGLYHSCALSSNGSVACWGRNYHGQLGIGTGIDIGNNELPSSGEFVKVDVPIIRLGTGAHAYHTCGLIANGSAICWGYNIHGQLGYGHTNSIGNDEYPASAGFMSAGLLVSFSDIRCGFYHTCGLYTNGSVK